jgi:antirestriction protein ArdC
MAHQDRVEGLLSRLEQGIHELASSENWLRYLRVQSKLHEYSPSNVQLALLQTGGTCTRLAGFRTWLTLGRHVRKGETAIWILAPIIARVRDETPEAGEPERRVVGFRTVPVFDIAQTEGEPLPEPVRLLDGEAPPALWTGLAAQVAAEGYSLSIVAREELGSPNGITDALNRTVRVAADLSPAARCKTLAHELAHIRCDHFTAGTVSCRGEAELQAESCAAVVLSHWGIDTSDYSLGYVSVWAGGTDEALASLKRSMSTIARVSRDIINGLGDVVAEEAA